MSRYVNLASTVVIRPFVLALFLLISHANADTSIPFATIGDRVISQQDFELEVYNRARQVYYHGQPPSEEEYIAFRKRVAEQLVQRYLLLEEAQRRGLEPDNDGIAARLAVYEARYAETERWQRDGERLLSTLKLRFEEDSLIDALQAKLRVVSPADDRTLRDYYRSNKDKFTEPEQNRVSVILLGIGPSAGATAWQAARDEARRIRRQLDEGADFSEFARIHSADNSADSGGDMGYLHDGMLSAAAEEAIRQLPVGGVTDAVTVLEGIALFKLTERKPEKLRSFEEVRGRVAELWARDQGEMQWQKAIETLRAASQVSVDNEYLVSLPGQRP